VLITTVWGVKGGSGASVVAAALALLTADRFGAALLVDRAGDQPALLGCSEPTGPGVQDWLAVPHGDGAALARLELSVTGGLGLLPRGGAVSWPTDREDDLARALTADGRPVVVDAGVLDPRPGVPAPAVPVLGRSLLVIRACYLALRRAAASPGALGEVVLVAEPGRALDRRDVAQVLGVPVRAVVEADPAVARAVDAGTLATRLPAPLRRSLRRLL
jgi:hypothetical protein